jgi:hydroxyacylglutathione hydrolase
MIKVHQLTYSPFAENTYVLTDTENNAVIIDPGMYGEDEEAHFKAFIAERNLNPVALWLTHAHLDHVFGVNFVYKNYGLSPRVSRDESYLYENAPAIAQNYGLAMQPLVNASYDLVGGMALEFGGRKLLSLAAPGHSPGSICFYCKEQHWVIGGDVLFQGSIGRTDLPGGDFDTLINSIKTQLFTLPGETRVYSGHGPATTIAVEKLTNPFLQE